MPLCSLILVRTKRRGINVLVNGAPAIYVDRCALAIGSQQQIYSLE